MLKQGDSLMDRKRTVASDASYNKYYGKMSVSSCF